MQSTRQRSNNSIFWLLGATSTLSIAISLNVVLKLHRVHEELRWLKEATEKQHREDHSKKEVQSRSITTNGNEGGEAAPRKHRSLAISDSNDSIITKADEDDVPVRFLRAGKGDEAEGRRRYEATLKWREENNMDICLFEAWPKFELIKSHYPHYLHGKGRNGEPVFFELPPKTDLKALREGGVDLDYLLHHYAMICEFQWQYISRDDFQRSIYIIDLEGIRMGDFVGECVDYVKRASEFTAQHYPERAGN